MAEQKDIPTINRFQAVILASRRARQLNEGVDASELNGRKITSVALEELEAGKMDVDLASEKGTSSFN